MVCKAGESGQGAGQTVPGLARRQDRLGAAGFRSEYQLSDVRGARSARFPVESRSDEVLCRALARVCGFVSARRVSASTVYADSSVFALAMRRSVGRGDRNGPSDTPVAKAEPTLHDEQGGLK